MQDSGNSGGFKTLSKQTAQILGFIGTHNPVVLFIHRFEDR